MSRIIELIAALVILVIAILSEWKVNTMNLIKSDFNNRVWLLGLIALILFSSILVLNKKQEKDHYDKLIECLKKSIMAFIIAYLAHLDFTLVPFWLVFIVAFFFHDWV